MLRKIINTTRKALEKLFYFLYGQLRLGFK